MPRYRRKPLGDKNISGLRIKAARENNGWSTAQFLAKIELEGRSMSKPTLSQIEGQHAPLRDKDLVLFARVLGVEIDWLLWGELPSEYY